MFLYTLAIHLYAFAVECASPFHKKARMMRFGQWKTNGILRDKIDREAKYIWFHAASLGEFEQGRPMMEKIKAGCPQYKILLTFFSPSGYEVRKNYQGADVICYLPFDTPYKVRKFVHLANPCMACFIKYEFWANYLLELKRKHIPVYSVSAIFRRDQWFFRWYAKPFLKVFRCFNRLFVQDELSAKLLAQHGITQNVVTGDTRFDRVLDVQKAARRIPIIEAFVKDTSAVVVAGSSWQPDEEMLIAYFNEHPGIKLIIAPHEIDRGHLLEIHSRLKHPSVRLSEADEQSVAQKRCLIIDSFGLLSSIYRYGEIAYIGGGFGKGVHNILEAAVYGVPVIFGFNYRKFKEANDLITLGGGFSVSGEKTFRALMDNLLASRAYLQAAGRTAGKFVKDNAGATGKILRQLSLL
ncbi:MAG: 3-deoxy-D-manno-octulosonic acid transferase [Bacteroidales bacterium]